MSTFVIGDIHGCFETLLALLDRIGFSERRDRLWLTGDLVNAGPYSLETLRWAKQHTDAVTAVLGNHDLYLLGRAGEACPRKKRDTLEQVLRAPDCRELLEWLRQHPLAFADSSRFLVHGGLLPGWTTDRALALSRRAERWLRGPDSNRLLKSLFSRKRHTWCEDVDPLEEACGTLQVMTTLRTCRRDGWICHAFTGPPREAPKGCHPWYSFPSRTDGPTHYYFGHWAALGLCQGHRFTGLDSGCAWGGSLSAVRLEDGKTFQQPRIDPPA